MSSIPAVVVDPAAPGRLVLRDVDAPAPAPGEAVVRVAALSLNRGEVLSAMGAESGARPGWDLAGTIERPAADGSTPAAGARVVGLLPSGAWAEVVAVPAGALAELPDAVSFAQAATLPVAGLTALLAVERGGTLLDRTVLITGASGGAGHFAAQLASAAGADVVGLVRQERHAATAREAGAREVVVSEDGAAAAAFAPYDLIVDSVGGAVLGNALGMLAPGGVCVNFGASAAPDVTFDVRRFFVSGGATFYGLYLFHEMTRQPPARSLGRLARLVAAGRLRPPIAVEALWTKIAGVAQQLLDRRFAGKAVLHVTR